MPEVRPVGMQRPKHAAPQQQVLSPANCPSRLLLDQIADKWSVLILAALCPEPLRFNAVKRRLEGITQKALTQALRRLQRNGLVARRVIPHSPVAVEYSVTPLGRTLQQPFAALYAWTVDHLSDVEQAQQQFDAVTSDVPGQSGSTATMR